MKLNYIKVLPFCMLLSLGFGACSSDDEIVEDEVNVEESTESFSKMTFSLSSKEGSKMTKKDGRAALDLFKEGNWEDGWKEVDFRNPSLSQLYPLSKIYAYVKQASDLPWEEADVEVLEYDMRSSDNGNVFDMEYLVKGDMITLRSLTGKIKSLSNKGIDIIFASQPSNVFKMPEHPYLTTPNGQQVYAASGDVLFRTREYRISADNGAISITANKKNTSAEEGIQKGYLVLDRGTVSYNTKLIITNKHVENLTQEQRNAKFKNEKGQDVTVTLNGLCSAEDFAIHTLSQLGRRSNIEDWTISTFIAKHKVLDAEQDAKHHVNADPQIEVSGFPRYFDMFKIDPSDKNTAGQAIFSAESGIVALTKAERAFVGKLQFPGYPIDYPIMNDVDKVYLEGVGKDFNYKASPYIYPFLIDGSYDVCFAIKENLRDGSYYTATFRFPIVNCDEKGNYPTIMLNSNTNLYTTIAIDIADFLNQWKNAKKVPAARGVSDNVVDLESNVLNIPYKMF